MKPLPTARIRGTDGVHAERVRRDASFVMRGHHCHSCFELFYVEQGACRFLINDQIHDLHAGGFILVPPMVLHYTRYVFGECTRTVILFRSQDVAEEVRRHMPGAAQFFAETSIFQLPAARAAQVEAHIRQLLAEEKNNDACAMPLRRSLLQTLLLLCARLCTFPREIPADIRTTDQHILRAARYISDGYMNPITTAEVAQAVGFSPNYLSRRFREAAGIGLHEYIVFVRLHHAAQELISTADSITDIALRCGFSDSNYFKDSFKKKYGLTPRAYRRLSGADEESV